MPVTEPPEIAEFVHQTRYEPWTPRERQATTTLSQIILLGRYRHSAPLALKRQGTSDLSH